MISLFYRIHVLTYTIPIGRYLMEYIYNYYLSKNDMADRIELADVLDA